LVVIWLVVLAAVIGGVGFVVLRVVLPFLHAGAL
jgi:hypothetical protein